MTYFDLRRHTRSISTCSPEAQRWFDLRRSGLGATRAIPFVKAECPQRVDLRCSSAVSTVPTDTLGTSLISTFPVLCQLAPLQLPCSDAREPRP